MMYKRQMAFLFSSSLRVLAVFVNKSFFHYKLCVCEGEHAVEMCVK